MSAHPLHPTPGRGGYTTLDVASPAPRSSSLSQQQQRNSPTTDPFYSRSNSSLTSLSPSPSGTPGRYSPLHDSTREGILTGAIGGGYGPYSPSSPTMSRYSPRRAEGPSPFANMSAPPSPSLSAVNPEGVRQHHMARARIATVTGQAPPSPALSSSSPPNTPTLSSRAIPVYTAADAAFDEKLHSPPRYSRDGRFKDKQPLRFSCAGLLNVLALLLIVVTLVTLFAGYPIIQWVTTPSEKTYGAYNIGGTNGSGQVPDVPGLRGLIDKDTPESAYRRTGYDGKSYLLTFSDEFNTDGRTFWPGDDPYWEAVDLHYWPTGDYEWYDPDAITTEGGNLKITLTQEPWRGMNFRSGMLQGWNKLCFSGGGIVEVSISLPGAHDVGGLWPGAWTIGNLGRAGYGATSDGTWPYSYSECDIGTLPNQTNVAGTGPAAALNTGTNDGTLSYLPGQKLSACTCPSDRDEHPGPDVTVGRGAPEIDIIEAQMAYNSRTRTLQGAVSQSAQFAPYDDAYEFRNNTPYTTVHSSLTELNSYKGGVYQQATSGVTYTDQAAYELSGGGFSDYSFEYNTDHDNGYITWASNGKADWTLTAGAVGPNSRTQVGQRLITSEPLYVILNLGISDSFQVIDYHNLEFPAHMLVDYVRIWQEEGKESMTCDPPSHPTTKYIQDHLKAYMNANYTTWEQAGYTKPKNSMQGC
ncbi:hypothetical protein JCM8547_003976 [Rhodosporidiobolus lusitaniae]